MRNLGGRGGGRAQIRTGHERVSEVVLAVLIIFHVFPFEGVAPASADSSGTTSFIGRHLKAGNKNLPTAFLPDSSDKIHDFAIALHSMDRWIRRDTGSLPRTAEMFKRVAPR